jgi:hypothetical protein
VCNSPRSGKGAQSRSAARRSAQGKLSLSAAC